MAAAAVPSGQQILTLGMTAYGFWKIYRYKFIKSNTVLELDFTKLNIIEVILIFDFFVYCYVKSFMHARLL